MDTELDHEAVLAPIFMRRIHPHRSLSRGNFHILLLVFCATSFVSSLPFVLMGAWPVAGFMGLDVLAFWFAFRTNFADAKAYEDITLTPLECALAKVSARGARRQWHFNPIWLRMTREEDEEYGLQKLALISRGTQVEVAGFLGPDAKKAFADEFSLALSEAKRGPRFS